MIVVPKSIYLNFYIIPRAWMFFPELLFKCWLRKQDFDLFDVQIKIKVNYFLHVTSFPNVNSYLSHKYTSLRQDFILYNYFSNEIHVIYVRNTLGFTDDEFKLNN